MALREGGQSLHDQGSSDRDGRGGRRSLHGEGLPRLAVDLVRGIRTDLDGAVGSGGWQTVNGAISPKETKAEQNDAEFAIDAA